MTLLPLTAALALAWVPLPADEAKPAAKQGDAPKAAPAESAGKEAPKEEEPTGRRKPIPPTYPDSVLIVKDGAVKTPLAKEPYRIVVWLQLARHPRLTAAVRSAVELEIREQTARNLGLAWDLDFVELPEGLPSRPDCPLDELPKPADLRKRYPGKDKVFWLNLGVAAEAGSGVPPFTVTMREFDWEFKSWGAPARRVVPPEDSLPQTAFQVAHRQFRAEGRVSRLDIFEVGSVRKVKVIVEVRGLSLAPPDSAFPLLRPAYPLRCARDFYIKDQFRARLDTPWTYLIYREPVEDRLYASCDLVSAIPGPLDPGAMAKNRVFCLAASTAEDATTEVRFYQTVPSANPAEPPQKRPVVGYEVVLRPQDQPASLFVGNTDRRGRVTLRPAQGLLDVDGAPRPTTCEITLRIGKIPVATFPCVPGDEPFREVPANPDPLLPEYTGRLSSLQEEIVDALATQALYMKRLDNTKAKLKELEKKEEAADKIDKKMDAEMEATKKYLFQLIARLEKIPKNEYFKEKLDKIRGEAEARQKELSKNAKTKGLKKSLTKLFEGVEKLIKDRQIGVEFAVKGDDKDKAAAEAAKEAKAKDAKDAPSAGAGKDAGKAAKGGK